MPNGKPGDHPYTDIVVHGRDIFTDELDELIRKIARSGGSEAVRERGVLITSWSWTEEELSEMRQKLEEIWESISEDSD